VVCETGDEAELHAYAHRLRQAGADTSLMRIDTLCGRLAQPTVYRLSRFMANSAAGRQ
jgi:hypothetical protein